MSFKRPLLVAAKVPEDMSQHELLAYVKILELEVERSKQEIERIKSDAIVTIGLLVHQMGDEAIIMPDALKEIEDYEYARHVREADRATIFSLRKKAPVGTDCAGTEGAQGQTGPEGFTPDGL